MEPGGYGAREAARFSPSNAFVASRALTYDMNLVPAGAWRSLSAAGTVA
ncbi:hypothetical protein [Streptomyces sp. NPDC056975]